MRIFLRIVTLALVLLPFVAAAQSTPLADSIKEAGSVAAGAGLVEGGKSANEILLGLVRWVLSFVAILALGVLIWGGIRYIMSLGNPGDIEQARKTILWAVVGIIVVLLSFVIITAIQRGLGL